MSASKAMSYADKVVHIIDTYGLPLPCAPLEAVRRSVRDATPSGRHRLAEEEAAIFLARHLHAMVMSELGSGIDSRAISAILDAWSKFAQQVMYRADLGLINRVLYNCEILPFIDDVEQILCEEIYDADTARAESSPPASGAPL
jgi:hypothetical protein